MQWGLKQLSRRGHRDTLQQLSELRAHAKAQINSAASGALALLGTPGGHVPMVAQLQGLQSTDLKSSQVS